MTPTVQCLEYLGIVHNIIFAKVPYLAIALFLLYTSALDLLKQSL